MKVSEDQMLAGVVSPITLREDVSGLSLLLGNGKVFVYYRQMVIKDTLKFKATFGIETNFGGATTTSPNFISSCPGKSRFSSALTFLCFFFISSKRLHRI